MARRSLATTTIADVAAAAGVSPATVSRVFNDHFVGEASVAERVRRVAAELSYSPNQVARSLALGRTRAIALVVPDLANPVFQEILSGLSKAAAHDGYRVLVADSEESSVDEPLLVDEVRRRCDAIVLCAPRMPDAALETLAPTLAPLVLINRPTPHISVPSVHVDYRSGIQALAAHLYQLGHRRLAFLEGPAASLSNRERLVGLDEFSANVDDVEVLRVAGGVTMEDGVSAAERVANAGASAVLAFNDLMAVGLLDGLRRLGVRVPEDLSVTGLDDIPFAKYATPALTTASVPHAEVGGQAWHRMNALLTGAAPDHDIAFQPRLEPRASTAAAPRSCG